jgi:hypothetical protein
MISNKWLPASPKAEELANGKTRIGNLDLLAIKQQGYRVTTPNGQPIMIGIDV